nr:hypothetical protein [Rhodoferax sp.]
MNELTEPESERLRPLTSASPNRHPHENAQKIRVAQQNLPHLRPGFCLAQKVGA